MKKYVHLMLACVAVIAFCAFLVFLFDLSGFDRIGKMCSIWESTFREYAGTARGAALMSRMDMLGILLSLLIFGVPVLELFTRYKYWIMLIPIIGFILFLFIAPITLCSV